MQCPQYEFPDVDKDCSRSQRLKYDGELLGLVELLGRTRGFSVH